MDIFKITTEDDKIIVEGTVNPHDPRSQRRVNLTYSRCFTILEDSGIDFGTCAYKSQN